MRLAHRVFVPHLSCEYDSTVIVLKPLQDSYSSIMVQNRNCHSKWGDAPAALPMAQGRGGVSVELEKKWAGSFGEMGAVWASRVRFGVLGNFVAGFRALGSVGGMGPWGFWGGSWSVLGIWEGFEEVWGHPWNLGERLHGSVLPSGILFFFRVRWGRSGTPPQHTTYLSSCSFQPCACRSAAPPAPPHTPGGPRERDGVRAGGPQAPEPPWVTAELQFLHRGHSCL